MDDKAKFYMVSRILDTISEAIGRLDAYDKVTTNTWGAITLNAPNCDIYNGLHELRNEAKELFFTDLVPIHITVIETKVNAYIKKYHLMR